MAIEQDKYELLDALYAMGHKPGKRPSIIEAQLQLLPDWDRDRLIDAAEALLESKYIMNPASALMYVDFTSAGRKLAAERVAPAPAQNINIGVNHNSPIQQVGKAESVVQNTNYKISSNDLQEIVELYHNHVDELNLDAKTRQRADAQIAIIEAELQGEPDQELIKSVGKSLKTIVEGALGGAIAGLATSSGVWATLLALF